MSDLALVDADSMSSFASNVADIAAVATINSLTTTQLQGLTSSQVSSMMNSPNYSQFSSAIREYCARVSNPSRTVTISQPSVIPSGGGSGSGSTMLTYSLINLFLSVVGANILLLLV